MTDFHRYMLASAAALPALIGWSERSRAAEPAMTISQEDQEASDEENEGEIMFEEPAREGPPPLPAGLVDAGKMGKIGQPSERQEELNDIKKDFSESGPGEAPFDDPLSALAAQNPIYDDADWHYDGDGFPADSPIEYGSTHIGFYLTWAAERDLVSDFFREETGADLDKVAARQESPIHLIELWDGSLLDDMMNEEGSAFSRDHYSLDQYVYIDDFVTTFEKRGMGIYRVAPTWENYDVITPVLDKRLEEWRAEKGKAE